MFKLHDRVKETSYTQGTGNLILREAVAGFRTFSSVYADQDSFFYCITNNSNYEIGIGKYVSTNNELERVEVLDSTTGIAISWGQGIKEIYVTYTATRSIHSDGSLSGDMVALVADKSSISGDPGFRYADDKLLTSTIELDEKITAPQVYVGGIVLDSSTTEQTEPFLRTELEALTKIDEVVYVSGEVDQILAFKKQAPSTVLAGPMADCDGQPCEDDYPYFRPISSDDLPTLDASKIDYNPSNSGDWSSIPTNARQALDKLASEENLYLVKDNNLSDLTNPSLARFNLGVGASGQDNSVNVTLTGSEQYLTINGQEITRGKIDLSSSVSGDLPVENLNGGSNADSTTFWRGDGSWSTVNPDLSGYVSDSDSRLSDDRNPNAHTHEFSEISGNLPVTKLNGGADASVLTFWRGDGSWSTISEEDTIERGTYAQGIDSAGAVFCSGGSNRVVQHSKIRAIGYNSSGVYTDIPAVGTGSNVSDYPSLLHVESKPNNLQQRVVFQFAGSSTTGVGTTLKLRVGNLSTTDTDVVGTIKAWWENNAPANAYQLGLKDNVLGFNEYKFNLSDGEVILDYTKFLQQNPMFGTNVAFFSIEPVRGVSFDVKCLYTQSAYCVSA